MELQKIFDTIALHLIAQGAPAVDDGGECVYRSPTGLKCAAGCLIPDSEYRRSFEGVSADFVPWLAENFEYEAIGLIQACQQAHDGPLAKNGLDSWIDEMSSIAAQYNLSTEALGISNGL